MDEDVRQAINKLAEAVSILLEHAGAYATTASQEEVAAANRAVDDALALVRGEGLPITDEGYRRAATDMPEKLP